MLIFADKQHKVEAVVNKIAQSGLTTIDLESFYPKNFEIKAFDLKPFLFKEIILKEKDFREALSNLDWHAYEGKNVAVFCSTDAIIPAWAYMLVAVYLAPFAATIYSGQPETWKIQLLLQAIENTDVSVYENGKIILKGCGTALVPPSAYMAMSHRLRPIVKSLMFGEPCSTVPVYKKKK